MEVSFRLDVTNCIQYFLDEFQSLFYWKYLSDYFCPQCLQPGKGSFNPCFIGSIFQTSRLVIDDPICLLGFNPCFIGSIFQTMGKAQSRMQRYRVSILVLLEVSFRPLLKIYNDAEKLFQSLFYWKYLSDFIRPITATGFLICFNPCFIGSIFQTGRGPDLYDCFGLGFNPCFIGSIFQTYLGYRIYDLFRLVSILVLLEVSFRPI